MSRRGGDPRPWRGLSQGLGLKVNVNVKGRNLKSVIREKSGETVVWERMPYAGEGGGGGGGA